MGMAWACQGRKEGRGGKIEMHRNQSSQMERERGRELYPLHFRLFESVFHMPRRALQSVGGSIESPGREKKVVQGGGFFLACRTYGVCTVWEFRFFSFFLSLYIYMWVYGRRRRAGLLCCLIITVRGFEATSVWRCGRGNLLLQQVRVRKSVGCFGLWGGGGGA